MLRRVTFAVGIAVGILGLSGSSVGQSPTFDEARSLFHLRRWSEAAAAFASVEKLQPGKTDALLFEGKCLVNLAKFDDAVSALQAYLGAHPTSDDANYLLAYVRFRQDRPKDSLDLLSAAAKLTPPTADDLKVGALDYVLLGDYSDAGHYLEEALKIAPDNVEARYHLGRVRYQQNRFDDSIAAFREVLRLDPANTKASDNLGLSLEAKNQVGDAEAAYEKAIELDKQSTSHNEQPYLNLGTLLTKINRAEEAVPVLQKAVEINPQSSQIRYQLGKAYYDLRRFPDAQQATEEAVRLSPKDSSAHYLLGRIYQRQDKRDLSAREFQLTEELRRVEDSGRGGMGSGSERR